MSINLIESPIEKPIEKQHTGKGNPNAILHFDLELNNRQKKILGQLPECDCHVMVKKNYINMSDLAAFTAKTGDEFAMFTKGSDRLIVRGNSTSVNIDVKMAADLAVKGYKWSGHTHPGYDFLAMQPSDGDYEILKCFKQHSGVIYNSKGEFRTYEQRR